ncbi:hypothetical protein DOTSEDRAFT_83021 [Dothistroma septosporum NZE10]|uniref:Uncharacterized protein n=1 Tax=Dothistroma septosporum (strain NZE10 / CBS 128990) TaxID=675120 RepID=M2WJL9_DOTSN|nr:hypothetical protein DOTSEDRAFT_83021 [Dothistroma septosporum NZE10]
MNGISTGGTGAETILGGNNTRILDPTNMPSKQASAARAKSQQVMEALRSGEPGAADRLMGDEPPKDRDGLLKRIKHRMGGGLKGEKTQNGFDATEKNELTKGTSLDDGYSVMTDESVMSRDGGKGDGVIR